MTERTYEAPGPGTWELDATHFSKPTTLYTSSVSADSLVRGFKEGSERYGLLLSYLKPVFIHGFCYMKAMPAFAPEDAPPGPPPPGFFEQPALLTRFENGARAIENKLWREDMKRWDDEIKPDSIRRNQKLQSVQPDSLDTEALIEHLTECHDNVGEMFYRHHIFTIPSLIPIGLYLGKVCQWAGISPGEALGPLKGSSPASLGLAIEEIRAVAGWLKQEGVRPEQFSSESAEDTLKALRSMPAPIGAAVGKYLDIVGYQLTSGYDITERYALETPEILVASIWEALARIDAPIAAMDDEQTRAVVRNQVPAEHQAEFDSLLEEARFINRLRDERGLYNEARALGIARRAVLEAGKRLHAEARLPRAEVLVHASHEEMLAMLRGDSGPGEAELLERENWYQSKSTDDAPPYLGPAPEPPPPAEALPEIARLAHTAIGAAIGNIFDQADEGSEPGLTIEGYPVSPGIYEGTARLVLNPADFHRLRQGDVLVTKNTAATFNVVLPLLGAIVTDRGGQLSHAAIVAREYGIPGIVGTRNATRNIADGSRIRVDGNAGTVEVLS